MQQNSDTPRFGRNEAAALFDADFLSLGKMASAEKKRRHGNNVFYRANAHLNPTNICKIRCPLCAYAKNADENGAFLLSMDEMLQYVQQAVGFGCNQIHIVSGIHPELSYEWHRNLISTIKIRFPLLVIKAWTAVEIAYFAKISGLSVRDVLLDMQSAGLSSLPGGGAEIFAPHVRKLIAPGKIDASFWLDVHRTAHSLGISTNATMLFGHIESREERIDHLIALRNLQDESLSNGKAAFETFVPLVFHPKGTKFGEITKASPEEILRTISVSRLVLDNFPHVKAYWISLGVSLAQIAIGFGADDIDGTVFYERIHHSAGSESPYSLSETELRNLILETGCVPVVLK